MIKPTPFEYERTGTHGSIYKNKDPSGIIDSTRGATIIPRRKRNYSGLSKRPLAIGDKVADKKPGFNWECDNLNWIEYCKPTEVSNFDAG